MNRQEVAGVLQALDAGNAATCARLATKAEDAAYQAGYSDALRVVAIAFGIALTSDAPQLEPRALAARRKTTDLTVGELRVAELTAKRLTNQEVARALTLEVDTIKSHLGHVYKKLGVHSRAEFLRVWAQRAGGGSA